MLSPSPLPPPLSPSVPGGELIERIITDDALTEGVAVRYLSQLISALDCLHQMNIAHLDIKVRVYMLLFV